MRHFKDFRRLGQGCALAALIALSMEPDPAMAAQPPVPISAAEYDRLTQAADRDAIRELVNRYFDAAWRQDAEMFLGELFAPKMEHITIGAGFAADGQLRADGSSTSQRHVTKGAGPLRELYLRALSAPAHTPLKNPIANSPPIRQLRWKPRSRSSRSTACRARPSR